LREFINKVRLGTTLFLINNLRIRPYPLALHEVLHVAGVQGMDETIANERLKKSVAY
jgi:hypothetical protein